MKTFFPFLLVSVACLGAFAQPQPVACYNFNGNLNEAGGGTPLQALGGNGTYSVSQQVCTKDSIYSWKLGQGLKLPIGTTFPKNNYTIELLFKFVLPYPKNWQRIIDFNDNTLDQGLYTFQNNLQMYTQFTGTSNLAQPNTWFRLFVTRDAVTDSMKGYINNNLEIQLKDVQKYGVFWTNLILFKDDIVVQGEEAAGSIDYMRIYNVPLSKKQIDSIVIKSNAPNVTVSGNQTICKGSSVTISASGAGNYSWNNGSTASSITVSPTVTTTYYVHGWNYLFCSKTCKDSDAVVITVNPGITLVNNVVNVGCAGGSNGSATINPTSGIAPYTYSWSNGGTSQSITGLASGTYTVTVFDKTGCTSSASINVTQPLPVSLNTSSTTSVCTSANGTASVTAAGGTGTFTYNWNNGQTTATATGLTAGSYVVTVSDANGCSSTAGVSVTGSGAASVDFTVSDSAGCANPFCATFTSIGSSIISYSWDFGDGSNSTSANPNHCYKNPGVYDVSLFITNNNGCTAQMIKKGYITVYPNPVADFAANPQQATILDPAIHFSDLSAGATAWEWNFGEISATSTLQNPVHTYKDTGCYSVSLVVENQYGCKDSIEKPVCIKSDFTFFMPNAFTPNSNGLNDLFLPFGSGIDTDDFSFLIYDRWGNLIWQTRSFGEGWDGKANNGAGVAQADVYVWKCLVKEAESGRKHSFIGSVTLVK